MAIKPMSLDEVQEHKMKIELKKMEELQKEVVTNVKIALDHLADLDHLYEIQEFIEDLIANWEEEEIELEEEYEDD